MDSKSPPLKPFQQQGTIHSFTPKLTAFEYAPSSDSTTPNASHTLLWLGGLSNGLLTVAYPGTLWRSLPPNWRLVQPILSSAYDQWGFSTLASDAAELAACISYFRNLRPDGKVVLMGHSTGCQDTMEILVGPRPSPGADDNETHNTEKSPPRARLDGAILQAPVSDRESIPTVLPPSEFADSISLAKSYVAAGRASDVLPRSGPAGSFANRSPITAERWLSLANPDGSGLDDYFSSDFSDEQVKAIWRRWPRETRLLVLWGRRDEFVPAHVNADGLLKRWFRAVKEAGGVVDEGSGVVEGANHDLSGDSVEAREALTDAVGRVVKFLEKVEREM